jgi:hypothetical protein
MHTEIFTHAETTYRQHRYLREADEYRLARSVSGRTSRLASLFSGVKALTSGSGHRATGRTAHSSG